MFHHQTCQKRKKFSVFVKKYWSVTASRPMICFHFTHTLDIIFFVFASNRKLVIDQLNFSLFQNELNM